MAILRRVETAVQAVQTGPGVARLLRGGRRPDTWAVRHVVTLLEGTSTGSAALTARSPEPGSVVVKIVFIGRIGAFAGGRGPCSSGRDPPFLGDGAPENDYSEWNAVLGPGVVWMVGGASQYQALQGTCPLEFFSAARPGVWHRLALVVARVGDSQPCYWACISANSKTLCATPTSHRCPPAPCKAAVVVTPDDCLLSVPATSIASCQCIGAATNDIDLWNPVQ